MNSEQKDEVVMLYLDDIIPNRFQPREVFDERALKELAVSIKEHGVIQPIIVRSVNGKYEIIAGERRYKASALAGLTKIPAIIRNLDDKESSKVALLENLQRKNLNPIEEARTYQKILELDQMTQEELAKTMGKSQSSVANKIRLLSLPDTIQDALLKEQISERHARTLLNIPDAKKQKEELKKIINNKMTVKQLEEDIAKMYPKEKEEQKNMEINELVNTNATIKVPDSPMTASTTDFVNNNPLMPTAELPEDTSDYGKVVIAPPEGETSKTPKFINFGEINDDEYDEDDTNTSSGNSFIPTDIQPIDVDKIKEKAADINATNTNNNSMADLDSLLNITTSKPKSKEKDYKFITPAEEIVKTDSDNNKPERVEDYFKTPDLIPVDLPEEMQPTKTNSKSLSELNDEKANIETMNSDSIPTPTISNYGSNHISSGVLSSKKSAKEISPLFNELKEKEEKIEIEPYNIQDSIEKIRNLVKDLQAHDVKVDIDEMNFDKSYQIIVKLEKTKEE